jgi:hypothetical protein
MPVKVMAAFGALPVRSLESSADGRCVERGRGELSRRGTESAAGGAITITVHESQTLVRPERVAALFGLDARVAALLGLDARGLLVECD